MIVAALPGLGGRAGSGSLIPAQATAAAAVAKATASTISAVPL